METIVCATQALHAAEFFAGVVRDGAADQRHRGGPVMQAQHQAGDDSDDSRDLSDFSDELHVGVKSDQDLLLKAA